MMKLPTVVVPEGPARPARAQPATPFEVLPLSGIGGVVAGSAESDVDLDDLASNWTAGEIGWISRPPAAISRRRHIFRPRSGVFEAASLGCR